MTKAHDIRPGQSIRVKGRTVTVTKSELGRQDGNYSISDGRWSLWWKSGSKSGMHRCPPDADVQTVYKPKSWWSW